MLWGAALMIAFAVVLAETALLRGLGLAALICGGSAIVMLYKRYAHHLHEQREKQIETMLETLQNRRHDQLNDLQVVYAYIKLKKYDRLPEVVQSLVEKLEVESSAAKLNVPELAWYLHMLAAGCRKFELAIETGEGVDLRQLPQPVRRVFGMAVIDAVKALERNAPETEGELPLLTIRFHTRGSRMVGGLYYDGRADVKRLNDDCQAIRKRLRLYGSPLSVHMNDEFGQERASIEISAPIYT